MKKIAWLVSQAKQRTWKVLVGVFLFYLIRDLFLYVLLPFLLLKSL